MVTLAQHPTQAINSFRAAAGMDFDLLEAEAARLGIQLGAGVTIAHLDEGWDLDHPGFRDLPEPTFIGEPPIRRNRSGHGTSVLGLHAGQLEWLPEFRPLVPGAGIALIQARDVPEFSAAQQVQQALDQLPLDRPNILLIARSWSSRAPHLPYEVKPGMREVLAEAARRGIVVVQAAGNGGLDLDRVVTRSGPGVHEQVTVAGDSWISPADTVAPVADLRGIALVVGACTATAPYSRWVAGFARNPQPKSNFGSRIDCWAPGEKLTTLTEAENGVMHDFGGTSGAAAIVAALIAGIQSILRVRYPDRDPVSPADWQERLRDPTGARPVRETGQALGSVPNASVLLERLTADTTICSGYKADELAGSLSVGARGVNHG